MLNRRRSFSSNLPESSSQTATPNPAAEADATAANAPDTPDHPPDAASAAAKSLIHKLMRSASTASPTLSRQASANNVSPSAKLLHGRQSALDVGQHDFNSRYNSKMLSRSASYCKLISTLRRKKSTEINRMLSNLSVINSNLDLIPTSNLNLSQIAKQAVKAKKVFTIDGHNPVLSAALESRGWIQKLHPRQMQLILNANSMTTSNVKRFHHAMDLVRLTKILQDEEPNFVWTHANYSDGKNLKKPYYSRLVGRHYEVDFATKIGLTNIYARISPSTEQDPDDPNAAQNDPIFPRSFHLTTQFDREQFFKNFRLTYCTSFLYQLSQMPNLFELFVESGAVTSDTLDFALAQVTNAMMQTTSLDAYSRGQGLANVAPQVFMNYTRNFQRVLQENAKIEIVNDHNAFHYIGLIRNTVQDAIKMFPYIALDGRRNIWILKPASSHCGRGITVMNNEHFIRRFLTNNGNVSYIAQKYIENPLLVYNTKFDMRQYFLITMDGVYFNVWMYRNCYLKFSGHEFTLDDLSRAVHVTNHTVQKMIPNAAGRSTEIPDYNMWTLAQFNEYLEKIGQPFVWKNRVYPGMVKSLITVLTACLEEFDYATNTFQLFGADFMITDDFRPVLIEINTSPDLSHSTQATKIVCTAVVQDLVKVVVDNGANPYKVTANTTGDFERILRIAVPKLTIRNFNMTVVGRSMKIIGEQRRKTLQRLAYNKSLPQLFDLNNMNLGNRNLKYAKKIKSTDTLPRLGRSASTITPLKSPQKHSTVKAQESNKLTNDIKKTISKLLIDHKRDRKSIVAMRPSKTSIKMTPKQSALHMNRNSNAFNGLLKDFVATSLMSSNRDFLLNKLFQVGNRDQRSKMIVGANSPTNVRSISKTAVPSGYTTSQRDVRKQSVPKTTGTSNKDSSQVCLQRYLRLQMFACNYNETLSK